MATSPPLHLLHILESLPNQVQRLNGAIQSSDHQQILEYTSMMMDDIYGRKQLLLVLFEIRSYALALNGQFYQAYTDAERMIKLFKPTPTSGYARMGHVLSMYGYQGRALKAYNEGLQVLRQHSTAGQRSKTITADLERGKNIAIQLSRKKIDPISTFPDEITKKILTLLSQNDRVVCIHVSKVWRKKILHCPDVWKDLDLGHDGAKTIPLAGVADDLCEHVKNLTIDTTTSDIIRSVYLKSLQKRHSKSRIESLRLCVPSNGIQKMQDFVANISIVLSGIQNTLTHLNVDIQYNDTSITLSTILSTCNNLTDLTFSTSTELSTHVGNFASGFQEHQRLSNLELAAKSISGQDIEPIIRRSQQLRRLAINGGDISVLDILIQTMPSNIETLGFNYSTQYLPPLEKGIEKRKEMGLLHLYIFTSTEPLCEMKMLQLLYKNKTTLETLYANTQGAITKKDLATLYTRYPDFNLEKIKNIKYDGSPWMIDEFLLQIIRQSTTLKKLILHGVSNMEKLADTLFEMPPLRCLDIWRSTTITMTTVQPDNETIVETGGESSLIRLFEKYAQFSTTSTSLESLYLFSSYEGSDDMLKTLAQIRTLKEINLFEAPSVSKSGITEFFCKIGPQLTKVNLGILDCVDDSVFAVLGEHGKNLSILHANKLRNVTDQGVRALVDKTSSTLTELNLVGCSTVTKDCVLDIENKVKNVFYYTP